MDKFEREILRDLALNNTNEDINGHALAIDCQIKKGHNYYLYTKTDVVVSTEYIDNNPNEFDKGSYKKLEKLDIYEIENLLKDNFEFKHV